MKRLPTKAHFGLQRYEQIFKLPNYKDSKKSTSWLNLQDIDFINIYSIANTDLNAHLTPTQREGKRIASSLYSPHWKGPREALRLRFRHLERRSHAGLLFGNHDFTKLLFIVVDILLQGLQKPFGMFRCHHYARADLRFRHSRQHSCEVEHKV